MTLTINRHRSEWLVAKTFSVSVCVDVKDGKVKRVKINGLQKTTDDSVYTDLQHLRSLHEATIEILQEVRAAQERTKLPEHEDWQGYLADVEKITRKRSRDGWMGEADRGCGEMT